MIPCNLDVLCVQYADPLQEEIDVSTVEATRAYRDIASSFGLSLAQMALAFVNSRPFLTSNIIGATSLEQLKENIDSIDIRLSEEILEAIEEVHQRFPNPAP